MRRQGAGGTKSQIERIYLLWMILTAILTLSQFFQRVTVFNEINDGAAILAEV